MNDNLKHLRKSVYTQTEVFLTVNGVGLCLKDEWCAVREPSELIVLYFQRGACSIKDGWCHTVFSGTRHPESLLHSRFSCWSLECRWKQFSPVHVNYICHILIRTHQGHKQYCGDLNISNNLNFIRLKRTNGNSPSEHDLDNCCSKK